MQARYLAASPYNLVRVILGERRAPTTTPIMSTRAPRSIWRTGFAKAFWRRTRRRASTPIFRISKVPDTGERLTRKGFIGLGKLEDYSADIVYRHEQTLTGPKKDRLELLRHTRAHFGQIFMLYPDPEGAVDQVLDAGRAGRAALDVLDEYGARHRLWPITDPASWRTLQALMATRNC